MVGEVKSECPHISSIVGDTGPNSQIQAIETYKTAITWNLERAHKVTESAKRRKIAVPTCGTCELSLPRPFVCLHCSFTGCWFGGHITAHLAETGHLLCADAKTGAVFCSACNNFVYDPRLDAIHVSTTVSVAERQAKYQVAKKLREPYRSWIPDAKDAAALANAEPISCQGRRGLLNLGQTCFLNAVLQCFAHNPLLRNFFLSDKHNWKLCKAKNCTCCEMDKFFTEIHSTDTTPYGPTSFLATTWRTSPELAGYAQRDAHEFFISALNQIHSTSRGSTNVSCNCIIHSTFAGQLQSDVRCERCGNVTSTIDPMLDISLELKRKGNETIADNTLAACLRRYTQPEKLGPKEYSCDKCGKAGQEASKRMSIRKLPPVLSFQLKRFEHKSTDKTSARKIDTPIKFTATLNMAPYTTVTMTEKEKENHTPLVSSAGPDIMYDYDLFAVINHEGQIDNGHYTSYARYLDEWYRFDDDKVTASSLGACLNSAAYMCFYVKRHLDYKPFTIPTYVLSRETEAVKEKQMEMEKEAARMKEVEDALLATV
ncbi:hypothetical protein PC9H_009854 [Pleurotus ostreatus]|uniref:Ubiquitin carboxyl-terminal hydrolase n=2 Tax=Pleurotus ostreatus TaxID=5322 RepID=A0A067NAR7_PLEO1|nr:uncharacterized protein PC9H_009854 [Pleurotus ostreatus]KAF7424547.1 hypothetical protein PC9H_009854 [Pleurotus ostreatus]KDQ25143.1 hypothetical protein PLEOSDRAFT_174456 [Pleurotus ostreatus PC15]